MTTPKQVTEADVLSLLSKLAALESSLPPAEQTVRAHIVLGSAGAAADDVQAFRFHAVGRSPGAGSGGLGYGGELDFVSLQSLMSQRQLAIQLTAGLMSSLDSSKHNVVHNIGS